MDSHGLYMMVGLITRLVYVMRACSVLKYIEVELEYGNNSSHDDYMSWIDTI